MTQYDSLPAAGLAQSVERLTAEREVAGSIPGARLVLTPFALQVLDLHVVRMTTQNGGPVSIRRRKNSVLN